LKGLVFSIHPISLRPALLQSSVFDNVAKHPFVVESYLHFPFVIEEHTYTPKYLLAVPA